MKKFSEALKAMEEGKIVIATVYKKKVVVTDRGSIAYSNETRPVEYTLKLDDGCLLYQEDKKWGVMNCWPEDIVKCGNFKLKDD